MGRPTNDRASREFEDAAIQGVSAIPGGQPIGAGLRFLQGVNDFTTAQYEDAKRTIRDPRASEAAKEHARAIVQMVEHRHGRP